MKKRTFFLIMALFILCLVLTGCGQKDHPIETTSEQQTSMPHDSGTDTLVHLKPDPVNEPSSNDHLDKSTDETYTYRVSGQEIVCKHDIDNYIYEENHHVIFDYISLAQDMGWKYAGYKADKIYLGRERIFMLADEYSLDVLQVAFEGPLNEVYDAIDYVYSCNSQNGSSNRCTVNFTRSDLKNKNENGETYYLNSLYGGGTINRDMAIIACYLLENISPNSNHDPLENIFGDAAGDIYNI